MKDEVTRFVEEMLSLIRRTFFAKATEKQFFQQKLELERAIAYPADWLRERGGQWVPIDLMRRILNTVIGTIKKHGDQANIECFSIYFMHCVQTHMLYHGGDDYLPIAKQMPAIGNFTASAVRDLKVQAGRVDPGAVLAQTYQLLTRNRRRKSNRKSADAADLFDHCNQSARPVRRQAENSSNLCNIAAKGADSPQTAIGGARDS